MFLLQVKNVAFVTSSSVAKRNCLLILLLHMLNTLSVVSADKSSQTDGCCTDMERVNIPVWNATVYFAMSIALNLINV